MDRATLSAVLHPAFLDLKALQAPGALEKTELLVLPYGSAVPTDGWKAIEAYLQHGGNLLVLGGQPLRVPVTQVGPFCPGAAAGYLLAGAGFAPHLRSPCGARCPFRMAAGLRV